MSKEGFSFIVKKEVENCIRLYRAHTETLAEIKKATDTSGINLVLYPNMLDSIMRETPLKVLDQTLLRSTRIVIYHELSPNRIE